MLCDTMDIIIIIMLYYIMIIHYTKTTMVFSS